MPERLQRLLGYFVHPPNLGSVEGRDPIEFITEGVHGNNFEEFIPEEAQNIIRNYKSKLKEAA